MLIIVKKKSTKEEDEVDDEKDEVDDEDSEKDIIVGKVYKYHRQLVKADGTTKAYIQTQKAPVYRKIVPAWVHEFNEKMNLLGMSTAQLNKINRIRNSILRNKCYAERNNVKQLNKAKALGTVSKKTEELMNLITKYQVETAEEIEKGLFSVLTLVTHLKKEQEEFNKEIELLDKGELDD